MINKVNNKKTKEIKLTPHEQISMLYDWDNYYIEYPEINKAFALGYVPVTRVQKMLRQKDTFFVFALDGKGYKVYQKTHDVKLAEWSYYNAPMHDMLIEMFKVIKNDKPNVQDKKVMKNKKDRYKNDIVLSAVFNADVRLKDNDSDLVIAAKQSLASIRPKDLEVIIIPERMPEY